jgi:hypothetical protein
MQREIVESPFDRVPAEILSAIFEEVHEPGRNGTIPPFSIIDNDLITLMLVCKAWKLTVLDTPRLWSKIEISGPYFDREDDFSWMQRQRVYVLRYLTRSKSTMLDIDLDLAGLRGGETTMDGRLQDAFRDFERSKEADDEFSWRWESSVRDQCIHIYYKLQATLAQMLVGEDGAVMQRWRSFKFTCPDSKGCIEALWPLQEYSALSLQELKLQMYYEDPPLFFKNTPALYSLLKLSLSGNITLDEVPECPNLLDLRMSLPRRWTGIDKLVQFSLLQTLEIFGWGVTGEPSSVPDLHLPQLHSLFLTTAAPVKLLQAFKLRNLPTFILKETMDSSHDHTAEIPDADVFLVTQVMIYLASDKRVSIQRAEFISIASKRPVDREDDASYSAKWKKRLISLFSQLQSAHTIGTNQLLLDIAVKTARACQNDGNLPSLSSIVEVDQWEQILQPPYATFPLMTPFN